MGLRSFGSGCTVSIQNLMGYALGSLLPGAIMDHIRLMQKARGLTVSDPTLLSFGFGSVQFGTLAVLLCSVGALHSVRAGLTEANLREAAKGREPLLAS